MAALSEQDRQDVEKLTRLIDAIRRFLLWLVFESGVLPDALRPQFREVFPIVEKRLFRAAGQLKNADDTESDTWRRLDDAGLRGAPLDLKLAIWNHAVAQTREPRHHGVLGRWLKPVLTIANSILGSLSSVFPFLDLVTEYKEGAEAVI